MTAHHYIIAGSRRPHPSASQDAAGSHGFMIDDIEVEVGVVCDGVGSKPDTHIGARVVVDLVLGAMGHLEEDESLSTAPTVEAIAEAARRVASERIPEAMRQLVALVGGPRQWLHTTIVLVVLVRDHERDTAWCGGWICGDGRVMIGMAEPERARIHRAHGSPAVDPSPGLAEVCDDFMMNIVPCTALDLGFEQLGLGRRQGSLRLAIEASGTIVAAAVATDGLDYHPEALAELRRAAAGDGAAFQRAATGVIAEECATRVAATRAGVDLNTGEIPYIDDAAFVLVG